MGIDFSASCERALAFAGQLARFYHGTLDLFHMLPVPPYPKYSRENYDADRAQALSRITALADRQVAGLVRGYHLWGGARPHGELFKCAARCGSDAVILGSHPKETQGKWYAGSTVEKVSAQAECPVFVLSDTRACRSATHRCFDLVAVTTDHPLGAVAAIVSRQRSTL